MSRERTWRLGRLARSRLYLCVGLRQQEGDLEPFLDSVLEAGVDLVQLRDKEASRSELASGSATFRARADAHGALFIVNDDPVLAAEVGADGVHVGQDDPDPAVARSHVGPDRIVGRSTHSEEQFDRALDEDADYLAIGPVRETPTKEGRAGTGLAPVRHAAEVADRPWYVTGGMSPATAPEVLELGAHGIVVVRAIVDADDPAAATRALREVLDR